MLKKLVSLSVTAVTNKLECLSLASLISLRAYPRYMQKN
jgi:hypothetical protein